MTRLRRGLVLFWAAWFSLVLATNAADALRALGLVAPAESFASGNFALVRETVSRHGVPAWGAAVLFAGVLAWQGAAAVLLWRAGLDARAFAVRLHPKVATAFGVGIGLWAAFLLADELFLAYAVARTHVGLFSAQLLTLLAIALLPDPSPPA